MNGERGDLGKSELGGLILGRRSLRHLFFGLPTADHVLLDSSGDAIERKEHVNDLGIFISETALLDYT